MTTTTAETGQTSALSAKNAPMIAAAAGDATLDRIAHLKFFFHHVAARHPDQRRQGPHRAAEADDRGRFLVRRGHH